MTVAALGVYAMLASSPLKTGAELLQIQNFLPLRGKKVGLITNHTAVVGNQHIIDAVHSSKEVELVALFGPEHGIRGAADAGAKIQDSVDQKTGIPIFSLYGTNRRPTPEMLRGCDALVFDIQDVGARFYTYISTLGLCMQSAAEAKIPFYVLDRPNPLGGNQIAGWIRQPEFDSFVGQYPIPIQSGLTMGELAKMIKGEAYLPNLENLELNIIPCQGWKRAELFSDYGTNWIAPSPNLPQFENALVYPGTCLFEGLNASEGRGTKNPFLTLGAPNLDSQSLAKELNNRELPGVVFVPHDFTPISITGMSSEPKLKNQHLGGLEILVTNPREVKPVELGIYLAHAFYQAIPNSQKATFFNKPWLAKLAGTNQLADLIESGQDPEAIIDSYRGEVEQFRKRRAKYLLY